MTAYPMLLSPAVLGDMLIPNRMLMSAMTRFRVTEDGTPTPLNTDYYSQRASAGLISTETAYVEPRGRLTPRTAGLCTSDHIDAWRKVTSAVHRESGRIFVQLCHAGRISHQALQPDGGLPIAPSPVAANTQVRIAENEAEGVIKVDAPTPRELRLAEISALVDTFGVAAERAALAGFDGVELHAGSGLLHQQFLTVGTNRRTDRYGGSPLNRCRFVLETLEALSKPRGAKKVGVKLAPNFAYNGTESTMEEVYSTYSLLGHELSRLDLAYVHVMMPPWGMFIGPTAFNPIDFFRTTYTGVLVGGGEFDRRSGETALATGRCDFIAFGRRFLANPDLPRRFGLEADENPWDEATLYTPTASGFVDYPALQTD